MGTLLLLGHFGHRRNFVSALAGHRLVFCHSFEAFQRLWWKEKPLAVLISAEVKTAGLSVFLQEGERQLPGLRICLVLDQAEAVPSLPLEKLLVLSGWNDGSWSGRFGRWLEKRGFKERRTLRQACRGGARLKDSDYSRQPRGRKFYGEVLDISAQGARLVVSEEVQGAEEDFFEVSLKDKEGRTRSYHAQVRWKRKNIRGETELGLQLLAEAA